MRSLLGLGALAAAGLTERSSAESFVYYDRHDLDLNQAPLQVRGVDSRAQSPFTSDLKSFIKEVMEEWKIPGMSIAVVDGDEIFAEGFGHAKFPDTLATPETLYYTGSTTKAYLAATISHMIDSKAHPELSQGWKTPISSIIRDDFVLKDDWATNHLTLDDAVSHRTGLTRHDGSWQARANNKTVTVKDVVRNLRNLPPLSMEPRTKWHYCNLMFVTLSHVVETITGKWLGDVLKETIWSPLGMNTTYFSLKDALHAPVDLARSYMWKNNTQEYVEMSMFLSREASGAGGIISNVVDYAKWVQCLIRQDQPFSERVHQDIRTPRFIVNPSPDTHSSLAMYGLGWGRSTIHGEVAYEHGGSTLTYGADVYWFPNLKYGLVALANADGASNEAESIILQRMIEDKLQVPPEKRLDIAKRARDATEYAINRLRSAKEILYPNLPKDSLPPTVDPSKLVGLYTDAGYGAIRLATAPHAQNADQTILVANRTELLFSHQLEMHHVSGDYWVAYLIMPGRLETQTQFHAARFNFGVDGQASGLEVELYDQNSQVKEGTVLFRKIE